MPSFGFRFSRASLVPLTLAATLAIALSCGSARAVTQTGAALLGYPIHPRLAGMGETGVADNSDPSTVFYNPANAVGSPRAYFVASRQRWPDDWFGFDDLWMGRSNAGLSWQGDGASPLTWGADFTLAKLDYGENVATLPDGTPVGTFDVFEKVASLALAVGIPSGERWEFRVGVAAKRWWAEYPSGSFTQDVVIYEPSAYAFDGGLTCVMRTTVDGWSVNPALALALIDAGPDFEVVEGEKDPLPRRFNFGASVRVESPAHRLWNADVPLIAVIANVDGMEPRYGDFEWGLGTELAVAQILYLRSGSHMIHQDSGEDDTYSEWGIGLGIPVSSLRARFDYTNSGYTYIKDHMGITLAWVF